MQHLTFFKTVIGNINKNEPKNRFSLKLFFFNVKMFVLNLNVSKHPPLLLRRRRKKNYTLSLFDAKNKANSHII